MKIIDKEVGDERREADFKSTEENDTTHINARLPAPCNSVSTGSHSCYCSKLKFKYPTTLL